MKKLVTFSRIISFQIRAAVPFFLMSNTTSSKMKSTMKTVNKGTEELSSIWKKREKQPRVKVAQERAVLFVNIDPNNSQPTILNRKTQSLIMIVSRVAVKGSLSLGNGWCSVALPLEANFTGSQQVALFNALVPSPTQLLSPGSKHATAQGASSIKSVLAPIGATTSSKKLPKSLKTNDKGIISF